jgi:hypothetical protein
MGWDYREVRRAALRQGWTIERRKNGEMFKSPDGITTAMWHRTPSDVNAIRRFVDDLRRGGFKWPR